MFIIVFCCNITSLLVLPSIFIHVQDSRKRMMSIHVSMDRLEKWNSRCQLSFQIFRKLTLLQSVSWIYSSTNIDCWINYWEKSFIYTRCTHHSSNRKQQTKRLLGNIKILKSIQGEPLDHTSLITHLLLFSSVEILWTTQLENGAFISFYNCSFLLMSLQEEIQDLSWWWYLLKICTSWWFLVRVFKICSLIVFSQCYF